MFTYNVDLGERSYPIHIGRELLRDSALLRSRIKGRALIVTSESVSRHYLAPVAGALDIERDEAVILPDGEEHKTLEAVNRIVDHVQFDARFRFGQHADFAG